MKLAYRYAHYDRHVASDVAYSLTDPGIPTFNANMIAQLFKN